MRRSLFVYACLAGAGGCIWVIAELIALVFPSLNDITRLHGLLGTAANPKARLWVLVLCNELPYWVLAVLSGAFIGVRCRRNWMRDAVIFSVSFFVFLASYRFLITTMFCGTLGTPDMLLPISIPLAVGAAVVCARYSGARRACSEDHHHCRKCGYNLRELASRRCPECGQTFDPAQCQSCQGLGKTRSVPRLWVCLLGFSPFVFLCYAGDLIGYLVSSAIVGLFPATALASLASLGVLLNLFGHSWGVCDNCGGSGKAGKGN